MNELGIPKPHHSTNQLCVTDWQPNGLKTKASLQEEKNIWPWRLAKKNEEKMMTRMMMKPGPGLGLLYLDIQKHYWNGKTDRRIYCAWWLMTFWVMAQPSPKCAWLCTQLIPHYHFASGVLVFNKYFFAWYNAITLCEPRRQNAEAVSLLYCENYHNSDTMSWTAVRCPSFNHERKSVKEVSTTLYHQDWSVREQLCA